MSYYCMTQLIYDIFLTYLICVKSYDIIDIFKPSVSLLVKTDEIMGNVAHVHAYGKEASLDSLDCQLKVEYGIYLRVENCETETNDRTKRAVTYDKYYTKYQSSTKKYYFFKKHGNIWEIYIFL